MQKREMRVIWEIPIKSFKFLPLILSQLESNRSYKTL